jgi:hypothetical protein
MNKNHWIIRVNDGVNFKNSKYPFWGVKRGRHNCIKTIISKINKGDILWFLTSKNHGGKFIGMSEFTNYYDSLDEPLLKINTFTNIEQNWIGFDKWDIQIHYKNLYIIENQNIMACIQCGATILLYETFKNKIKDNLYIHYNNFKFYRDPIKLESDTKLYLLDN